VPAQRQWQGKNEAGMPEWIDVKIKACNFIELMYPAPKWHGPFWHIPGCRPIKIWKTLYPYNNGDL
jgi:hypothetical protein